MNQKRKSVICSTCKYFYLITTILALQCVLIQPVQAESLVHWWVSSSDMSRRLSLQEPLSFVAGPAEAKITIHVDAARKFQSILGLGSSLEHSTCYNISRLPKVQQAKVIESLVNVDKGIGMSLMRICIGTPDFTASEWYSYDDMPASQTDPELEHFSIDKDRQYVLPVLKLALRENPELILFASAWSPPGWMKTNRELCGGRIDPKQFPSLARYFARFIEAYAAEGMKIYAMTPQNEPGYYPNSYPTCG